jgi:hypothetical protein
MVVYPSAMFACMWQLPTPSRTLDPPDVVGFVVLSGRSSARATAVIISSVVRLRNSPRAARSWAVEGAGGAVVGGRRIEVDLERPQDRMSCRPLGVAEGEERADRELGGPSRILVHRGSGWTAPWRFALGWWAVAYAAGAGRASPGHGQASVG